MTLPVFTLDIPKMGDVIAYRFDPASNGWLSNLFGRGIQKIQLERGFAPEQACYTHVEVSGGGQYSVYIAPPKSRVIDITQEHAGQYIKIMRPKILNYEKLRKSAKVAFWAASCCNLPYDFGGVMNFVSQLFHQSGSRWFCSENSLWAIQKEFPEFCKDITPDGSVPAMFLGNCFECVWEGVLQVHDFKD